MIARPVKKVTTSKESTKKAAITTIKTSGYFNPMVRSRHPSHNPLREKGALGKFAFRSVIRLGSTTPLDDDRTSGGNRVEVNTVQAVTNSANKKLMKTCFSKAGVRTAEWTDSNNPTEIHAFFEKHKSTGIVAKSYMGSRNNGNTFITTKEQLTTFLAQHNPNGFLFEKYFTGPREYRLHVTADGCFYTCRKMIKKDTPEKNRWYRNDSNSTWIIETNPSFNKPKNWNKIVAESVKALNAVGLDIGAVDLKVQSDKTSKGTQREEQDFIIIEINSAPSFGDITLVKYKEILPIVIKNKYASK